jgi:fructosamine-3-kinase
MLTASFQRSLEQILRKKTGVALHFRRLKPLAGGSINLSARLDTTAGSFFLKVNDAYRFPGMFEKEANGLEELRKTNTITIPKVIMTGEIEEQSFLMLEFIESTSRMKNFWESFGKSLALLHKVVNEKTGYHEDNYIGSLVQHNTQHGNWVDFFIEERIEKQLKPALASGLLKSEDAVRFRKLYLELESIIPSEPFSLVHGDLWNGNFIIGNSGEPCLIYPAVYYGHREMDLSMTKLFGGFDPGFYEAYHAEFPLQPGFEERVDIHNLYPLLVHVNLFGGGYAGQVRDILRRFN